jgi:hypothetical protein
MGLLVACAMVSLLAVAAQNVRAATGTPTAQGGGRIEGTWDVQVSIVDCQTGGVIATFASTTMFMQGGTMIDSTSGIPQALKTPGQGVWTHSTDNTYVFRFKSFSFDGAGNYTGYTIIQHEATLNSTGDAYTSAGTAQVYTPGGVLVFTGCSTTVATRFGL